MDYRQYQMFKKCKENQCVNRQMLDFYNRQFCLLKQLANKCSETAAQIVADQIRQTVQLMQKRMLFVLEDRPAQQFHDYVSDFYQDKLDKLRKDLNRQIVKSKQLQIRLQDQVKQTRSKDEMMLRSKPIDMVTANQNMTLKNQLIHSQQLMQQNQAIMQEQNRVIQELNAYVVRIQDREKQSRVKCDEKIRQLDEVINSRKRSILDLTRQFEAESKKIGKSFREVELMNISLLEEKDKLQGEVVIKSEEMKLLSNKIYEQTLIINKFERAIDHSEAILLEEKIQNNRTVDFNKALKDKLKDIERQYQDRLDAKSREVKELVDANTKLEKSISQLEAECFKNASHLQRTSLQANNKGQVAKRIQGELAQYQQKCADLEREIKKYERKDKQNSAKIQQLEQSVHEKEGELAKYKHSNNTLRTKIEHTIEAHIKEKESIKADLETEFKNITDLNNQILRTLEKKEKENANLVKQYEEISAQNSLLNQGFQQLSASFEEAKKMINKVQQEKQDLDYIRGQLQIRLKHTQRKYEQLVKESQQRNDEFSKNAQLQELLAQMKKTIRQKETEVQRYKKTANEQSSRKTVVEKGDVRLLKQQMCKKQFVIKQLNSKISILQEELRQSDRSHHIERQKMSCKIKELQEIIQDRFELTNRLVDSSFL